MRDELLIKTEALKKVYRMGKVDVRALNGVSLEITEGEYVAIMGPSGSGKSTLLHILGCLDSPTEGKYILDGEEIQDLKDTELAEIRRRKTGFVFQSFNLLPRLTALENVILPMYYAGIPHKKRREIALELLRAVGLAERAHHKPTELSGGENQRVAIARSLANNPKIILADEPTGNLDTATSGEIMDVFDKLHSKGRTIIVVTHDREVAERAERIMFMRDGIIEKG